MIETQSLILKKGRLEDWKDMYINLWRHKESARDMLWKPIYSEEEAVRRMKKNLMFMEEHEPSWFVYEKKSRKAIGFAGMEKISENVYEDTGIAIGPDYTGRGYGKEILLALVQEAVKKYGAEKFIGSCRRTNVASRKLQLSCGFTYIYSKEKVDLRDGQLYILDFYELNCKGHFTAQFI